MNYAKSNQTKPTPTKTRLEEILEIAHENLRNAQNSIFNAPIAERPALTLEVSKTAIALARVEIDQIAALKSIGDQP